MDIFAKLLLLCILLFIIGFVMWYRSQKRLKNKYDGTIVINKVDPNKDTYRIELDIPFGELDGRDRVIFKVTNEQ